MADTADYEHGQPKPVPNNGPSMHTLVIKDIEERREYGLKKYDSLLQTYNGRNFLQDAYEEVQDLIVYLKGSLEEQKRAADIFERFLTGYVFLYNKTYPERQNDVMVSLSDLPGWMREVFERVLGDRFEYTESN